MRESTIQTAFAHWLNKQGIYFTQPRSDKRSTIKVGHPDFTVYLPGRVIHVETKAPGGKVRPEQAECHGKLRELGHAVYVETDVEGCVRAITGAALQPLAEAIKDAMPVGERVIYGNAVWILENGALIQRVRTTKPGDERQFRTLGQ